MYLVDTSVWVDYLRGKLADQVRALKNLLSGTEMVGTAPIILQEILQGADSPERYETWKTYFTDLLLLRFVRSCRHPHCGRTALYGLPQDWQDTTQQQ